MKPLQKILLKLAAYNIGIVVVNIVFFALLDFSPAGESVLEQAFSITLIVMSVAVFFLANYRLLTAYKRESEQVPEPVFVPEVKEDYRDTLLRFKAVRPLLQEEIDMAVSQIDGIDRKQKKLAAVLQRNDVLYQSLYTTAEETESIIFNNIKIILNRITIWDEKDAHKTAKQHIYADHRRYIHDALQKNEDILTEFDVFMAEASKINSEAIPQDSGLQATIKVLGQMYRDNLQDDAKG